MLVTTAAGCAASSDDDAVDGDESAVVDAAGEGAMAGAARDIAKRIAARDPSVAVIPLTGSEAEALPSATHGRWNVAFVQGQVKGVRHVGFLLLPGKGVAGSFGLTLGDAERHIVATAAYVPDSESGAREKAKSILEALITDAPRFDAPKATGATGAVRTQSLANTALKGVAEILSRLLGQLEKKGIVTEAKALATAQASVARKLETPLWKDFAAFFRDPKVVAQYADELTSVKKALGNRKVILVESADYCGGGRRIDDCLALAGKTLAAFERQLGDRAAKVALALRDIPSHAPLIRWALEHRIPVVISSASDSAAGALRNINFPDEQTKAFFTEAVKDPKLTSLIRMINPMKGADPADGAAFFRSLDHRELVPLWGTSDEIMSVVVNGERPANELLQTWARIFESATDLRVQP